MKFIEHTSCIEYPVINLEYVYAIRKLSGVCGKKPKVFGLKFYFAQCPKEFIQVLGQEKIFQNLKVFWAYESEELRDEQYKKILNIS